MVPPNLDTSKASGSLTSLQLLTSVLPGVTSLLLMAHKAGALLLRDYYDLLIWMRFPHPHSFFHLHHMLPHRIIFAPLHHPSYCTQASALLLVEGVLHSQLALVLCHLSFLLHNLLLLPHPSHKTLSRLAHSALWLPHPPLNSPLHPPLRPHSPFPLPKHQLLFRRFLSGTLQCRSAKFSPPHLHLVSHRLVCLTARLLHFILPPTPLLRLLCLLALPHPSPLLAPLSPCIRYAPHKTISLLSLLLRLNQLSAPTGAPS